MQLSKQLKEKIMPDNLLKLSSNGRRQKVASSSRTSKLSMSAISLPTSPRRRTNNTKSCRSNTNSSNSNSCTKKRVRFGKNSLTVFHQEQPIIRTHRPLHDEKANEQALWYNTAELHALFLLDLQRHLQQQQQQIQQQYQKDDNNSTEGEEEEECTGRGLELHLAHNQRRKEQADNYVRAVVEKSNAVHQTSTKTCSKGRKSSIIRRQKRNVTATAAAAADEILQEYASQLTLMTRDVAIGVAAQDEAEARAIHQEEQQQQQKQQTIVAAEKNLEKDSTHCVFLSLRQQHHQKTKAKPFTYTAKSA